MKHKAEPAPKARRAAVRTLKRPNSFVTAGVAVLTLGTAVAILPGATATGEYKPDGSSSLTAAASCWEIKQNNPAAPSGTYWLWTPQMSTPAQFYCDQENNGGGWVMIGRGREGWTESYNGKGKAPELHANPEGWSCTLSCTQNWSNVRFTGQSPFIFDSNYTYGRVTGQMLTPVLADVPHELQGG